MRLTSVGPRRHRQTQREGRMSKRHADYDSTAASLRSGNTRKQGYEKKERRVRTGDGGIAGIAESELLGEGGDDRHGAVVEALHNGLRVLADSVLEEEDKKNGYSDSR